MKDFLVDLVFATEVFLTVMMTFTTVLLLIFEVHFGEPLTVVKFVVILEIVLDDEKLLVMLFVATMAKMSSTVTAVFTITMVVSGSLLLVGASVTVLVHLVHHLVEPGWEEKMEAGAGHEDDGEDQKSA